MKHSASTENIVAIESGLQRRNHDMDPSVTLGSSSSFVEIQVLKFRCLLPCRVTFSNTGLFKIIVGVQLSSGNSAPNSGNNHNLTIPFEDGMHGFKKQGACVSRNWRYESEPPLKPSPLTCYRQFGTNSIIVLMFVESQRVHIYSTCKVCNKKSLECCSIKKNTYSDLKCLVYDKLLKPRQSFWITLCCY